jgi:hypothetical protein
MIQFSHGNPLTVEIQDVNLRPDTEVGKKTDGRGLTGFRLSCLDSRFE